MKLSRKSLSLRCAAAAAGVAMTVAATGGAASSVTDDTVIDPCDQIAIVVAGTPHPCTDQGPRQDPEPQPDPKGPVGLCEGHFQAVITGTGYNSDANEIFAFQNAEGLSPNSIVYPIAGGAILPAGTYNVYGGFYDGHDWRQDAAVQPAEVGRVFIHDENGNTQASYSFASFDLADGVNEAQWLGSMGQITLDSPGHAIEVFHASNTGINSVHPFCVGLEPLFELPEEKVADVPEEPVVEVNVGGVIEEAPVAEAIIQDPTFTG